MCGLLIAIGSYLDNKECLENCLKYLRRRGPDSQNVVMSPKGDVWLGHTRLAIQDTSSHADQPFISKCKRYVIIYNGELYNVDEIISKYFNTKDVLRSSSDTELILELYIKFGSEVVHLIRGMYSFVIWDNERSEGFLARDPYGIKPLYYIENEYGIVFCSQIKPLILSGLIIPSICESSAQYFKTFGNLGLDKTLFSNIHVFPAGTSGSLRYGKLIAKTRFADFGINETYRRKWLTRDEMEYVHFNLTDSIKRHMIGDVNKALFLSNGIDSSVIATTLCNEFDDIKWHKPISSLTITFPEYIGTENDESPAASFFRGTAVSPLIKEYSKFEFEGDIDTFFDDMDSPTIDGFNVWCISKFAKQNNIKVTLSGVGGDELFFGYSHMQYLPQLAHLMSSASVYRIFIHGMKLLSNNKASSKKKLGHVIQLLEGEQSPAFEVLWLLKRAADISKLKSFHDCRQLLSSFLDNADNKEAFNGKSNVMKAFLLENNLYLKSQLLRDADWAGMAHGVEVRTPFVDYSLYSNIKHLIPSLSLYKKKAPMYEKLHGFPQHVIARKKSGFNIPVRDWTLSHFGCKDDLSDSSAWINFVYDRYTDSLKL